MIHQLSLKFDERKGIFEVVKESDMAKLASCLKNLKSSNEVGALGFAATMEAITQSAFPNRRRRQKKSS
jgi:hypothetical protein